MRQALAVSAFLLFLAPSLARANNLAVEWLDRVTHEVEQQDGPLSTRPLDLKVRTGLYGYYTDNLFLEPNNTSSGDSAVIGLAGARLDYADARFEATADALVNFDYYMETHSGREDEERFYGKVRYADGGLDLELVEIARRESDPIDAIFIDHARRIVSDTMARAGTAVARGVKIEVFGNVQVVRFEGSDFDAIENENYRVGMGINGDVTERLAVVLQGGWLAIRYRDGDGPPDADGWFVRAGLWGELSQRLKVEGAVGWTGIKAEDEEAGEDDEERQDGLEAEVHVRWEASDKFLVLADYMSRFGFAGGGASFQAIDRAILILEYQVAEPFKVRARGQWDHVNPSEGNVRTFASAGLGATYRIIEPLTADGGVIWRYGNTHGIQDDNYDNWIVYLGLVLTF